MSNSSTTVMPVKQVTKISPLMPISVLLLTATQGYKILHKYCMADKHGLPALEATCKAIPGRYFTSSTRLDQLTCALVEFWKSALWDPPTRILLLEFSGLITTITFLSLISANRSSAGTVVKWGTTTFMLVMQVLGAAVIMPIYFAIIIARSSSAARASFMPSASARALLPALFVGFLLPSIFLMAPEILGEGPVLEWAIAVWQIFPLLVSAVMIPLSACFDGYNGALTTSDAIISTTFIISSMDFAILLSFLAHLYSLYSAYTQGLGLADFVPHVELRSTLDVVRAFLTFDLLGSLVSTWTLIFYDTTRFAGVGRTSLVSATLIAVFGTLFLGPGGATAWAWSNIEKARLRALVADRPAKDVKRTQI